MTITTGTDQSGQTTYETTARGTSYYLRRDTLGRWELTSQRVALRAARMGGTVRHFETLERVGTEVRAFSGLHLLAA